MHRTNRNKSKICKEKIKRKLYEWLIKKSIKTKGWPEKYEYYKFLVEQED